MITDDSAQPHSNCPVIVITLHWFILEVPKYFVIEYNGTLLFLSKVNFLLFKFYSLETRQAVAISLSTQLWAHQRWRHYQKFSSFVYWYIFQSYNSLVCIFVEKDSSCSSVMTTNTPQGFARTTRRQKKTNHQPSTKCQLSRTSLHRLLTSTPPNIQDWQSQAFTRRSLKYWQIMHNYHVFNKLKCKLSSSLNKPELKCMGVIKAKVA